MRLTFPTPGRVALALVVAAVLTLGALVWFSAPLAAAKPSPSATPSSASGSLAAAGRELFSDNCSSCHGTEGQGTGFGPPLINVGAASADFMLRTGRMPLADPSEQAVRKPPAFNPHDIQALVAYVGSLGSGPDIPKFNLTNASLSQGNDLFTVNCAPCHGVTGAGDAIGGPAFAPSLRLASALDVQEAVLVGPGQMPKFGSVIDQPQIDDITRFVQFLRQEPHPGGADLGSIGPVPEGFVAWFLGAGVLVIITILFVARPNPASSHGHDEDEG